MHTDNLIIMDPSLPSEYTISVFVLEELCYKGILDIFELSEAIDLLRKKFNLPTINIYGQKDSNTRI